MMHDMSFYFKTNEDLCCRPDLHGKFNSMIFNSIQRNLISIASVRMVTSNGCTQVLRPPSKAEEPCCELVLSTKLHLEESLLPENTNPGSGTYLCWCWVCSLCTISPPVVCQSPWQQGCLLTQCNCSCPFSSSCRYLCTGAE